MILQNNKQKAFTIVELLIVIVVIGILAAISIVAYNGIQNRARDTTAKDSAGQLRSKIETWNSIQGSYPSFAQIDDGLDSTQATESRLSQDIVDMLTASATTAPTSFEDGQVLQAEPCGSTGVEVHYWQSSGTPATIVAGQC